MRAEACVAALVARVEQGDVHHRVRAVERGVAHEDAEAGSAQTGDARIAGDDGFRHFGQVQPLGDDAELDVALEDFRKRLRARFGGRVAGGHAVAHVQVADDVDREPDHRAVPLTRVGQGADAARGVARVEVDQRRGLDLALRIVEGAQFGRQQAIRPGAVRRYGKPALARIVHVVAGGDVGAEVMMVPEVA